MHTYYCVRSPDGASVFRAETLIKARELRDRAQRLMGGKMRIVKVTPLEEVVE